MKQIDLRFRINILDEALFMCCAKGFYLTSWGQELETTELGAAALELIALSNMNPCPVDQGFEYVTYDHSEVQDTSVATIAPSLFRLKCQNCNFTSERTDFIRAKDLLLRVELGEPFTDSECPNCGALAHPENENTPPSLAVMEMFLRKLDEYTSNLSQEEALFDLAKLAMSLALMKPNDAIGYAKEVLEEMQK